MENTQQKVRHIPIFVEGRDEPIINKGHDGQSTGASQNATAPPPSSANNTSAYASAESSSGPQFQNHHSFGRPPMNFGTDMGFGQDMPMPTGSIFERAKDFPIRSDFFNMRSASPRRSESPIGVHHHTAQPTHTNHHQSRNSPSPAGAQQRQPTPQNLDRSVPVQHDVKRSTTPQRQQAPPQADPQQQQQEAAPEPVHDVPAKQKAIEDSITKIQKIQKSVLDLMERVEMYDGVNRKEYSFLDEMLTQNLLKLDDIDAEGKENIKNARREAIKCINSLISLLEAKKDEAASRGQSESKSEAGAVQDPPTQNGIRGGSKNSSYDNVNNVKQTSSNNSVNMAEVTVESSLEAKLQEAMNKQNEQK